MGDAGGNDLIDRPRPVREGEELDLDRLAPYLRDVLDAPGADVRVEQFPAGHSNLTYLLHVGDESYVLRRPPFGSKVKGAHDMGREHRVLSHLSPAWKKAPRAIHHCDDESVLGAEFYLMERVEGIVLRRRPPAGLDLDAETAADLADSFIDTLVELHAIDYRAIGLGDLGKPDGYVERQVHGWSDRYRASQTDDIAAMEAVGDWLHANLESFVTGADGQRAALIHNDYKYDNLVLDPDDPTRILAVVDWEMATIGDPLLDLGTTLCYWVQADDPEPLRRFAFGPTRAPGTPTRRQLADRYAERSGRHLDDVVYAYAFGLYKTAVVAQQIYYRWTEGHTTDERFASMIDGVRVLGTQGVRTISRNSLP